MKGDKQPRWIIADEWAVDTDPYNWILYSAIASISLRHKGFFCIRGYFQCSIFALFYPMLQYISKEIILDALGIVRA